MKKIIVEVPSETDIANIIEKEVLDINGSVYVAKDKVHEMLVKFAAQQIEKAENAGGWISVNDALPQEGQVVDVWRMPSFNRQKKIAGLKPPTIGSYEITGYRSTNWIFKKEPDGDEVLNTFHRCTQRTPETICSYPEYQQISVENGEVTHWRPKPEAPHQNK